MEKNRKKCHLKGKTCSKLANGLNLYDLKKKLTPEVALTLTWGYIHNTILVKQVYWYISQVSGERLQDHWSSGFIFFYKTVLQEHLCKIYCRSGNIRENLIFANIHELVASKFSLIKFTLDFVEYMVTHSRIQELANNSEIENSQNKSHAKISEFTVHNSC